MNTLLKKTTVLIATSSLMLGCSFLDVRNDLAWYVNDALPPIDSKKNEIVKEYNEYLKFSQEPSTTQSERQEAINRIIDSQTELVTDLQKVRPKTNEIRTLHELYIDKESLIRAAFLQVHASIPNEDTNLISQADEKISLSEKKKREFRYNLETLAKSHGIDISFNR